MPPDPSVLTSWTQLRPSAPADLSPLNSRSLLVTKRHSVSLRLSVLLLPLRVCVSLGQASSTQAHHLRIELHYCFFTVPKGKPIHSDMLRNVPKLALRQTHDGLWSAYVSMPVAEVSADRF